MAGVVAFMEEPLVTWVRTFSSGEPIDFQDLCDGVFLYDVLCQIDSREFPGDIHRSVKDSNARIQNWSLFVARLKSFYQEVLQQLIVMELPNIMGIVKESTKDGNLADLKKVLLLLLGCAVQCDKKEEYINKIRLLEIKTQVAVAEHIRQITEMADHVLPLDLPELDDAYREVYRLLRKLSTERDKYTEGLVTVTQERDYYQAELEEKRGPLTPPSNLEKYHLTKELNKHKTKLKSLTEELDEKLKTIIEMKEEILANRGTLTKLRTQNFDLQRKARNAQAYRDELDSLKEQALKVEKYEKDICRYKERINELDFYKCRVEELREDNTVLSDGKTKLEEQLATANKRMETVMDDLVKSQLLYEETMVEKENLQRKLHELVDENAALEFERSNMKEGQAGMRRMLSTTSLTSSQLSLYTAHHKNISEELKDSVTSHLAKLEQENEDLRRQCEQLRQKLLTTQREYDKTSIRLEQELQRRIAEMEEQTRAVRHQKSKELTAEFEAKVVAMEKHSNDIKQRISQDYRQRMTALEDECHGLKKQVEALQSKWNQERAQHQKLEQVNRELCQQKEQLKETISCLQKSSDSKVYHMEDSFKTLQDRVSVVKDKTELSNPLCMEDLDSSGYSLIDDISTDGESTPVARSRSPVSLTSSQASISSLGNGHPASASTQGVVLRPKPARGVVAPQRRSTPVDDSVFQEAGCGTAFRRDDKLRASVTPSRPRSEVQPFSRGSVTRQSMPERKIIYVMPEPRSRPTTPTSRHGHHQQYAHHQQKHHHQKHHQSMDCIKSATPNSLLRDKSKSKESLSEKIGRIMNFRSSKSESCSSDRDSGHATSPESPGLDDSRDSAHMLTSLKIVSSETIRTRVRSGPRTPPATAAAASTPKVSDKWRMFVEKMIELQDRNQELLVENSELKRDLAKLAYATERLDLLEDRNLQLEVENRKLIKIIESLQGSGRNPHDNREYHYYSSV